MAATHRLELLGEAAKLLKVEIAGVVDVHLLPHGEQLLLCELEPGHVQPVVELLLGDTVGAAADSEVREVELAFLRREAWYQAGDASE